MLEKHIDLPQLDSLVVNNSFYINLVWDTLCYAKIVGSEFFIEDVSYLVEGKTLILSNSGQTAFLNNQDKIVTVEIHSNTLEKFKIEGAVKMKSLNTLRGKRYKFDCYSIYQDLNLRFANAEDVYLILRGTGNVYLKGSTKKSCIDKRRAHVFADSLQALYADVYSSGTGDCHVHATEKLWLRLLGSSRIFYYGNPDTVIIDTISPNNQLIKAQ